jgi:hypothetical protein
LHKPSKTGVFRRIDISKNEENRTFFNKMMWIIDFCMRKHIHFDEKDKYCGQLCKNGASGPDAPQLFRN